MRINRTFSNLFYSPVYDTIDQFNDIFRVNEDNNMFRVLKLEEPVLQKSIKPDVLRAFAKTSERITKEEFRVDVVLPGLSKEETELTLDGNTLSVNILETKTSTVHSVQPAGIAYKTRIPKEYNIEAITATMVNGILTIIVPANPQVAARKITIS